MDSISTCYKLRINYRSAQINRLGKEIKVIKFKRTFSLPRIFDDSDIDGGGDININNPKLDDYREMKTSKLSGRTVVHTITRARLVHSTNQSYCFDLQTDDWFAV